MREPGDVDPGCFQAPLSSFLVFSFQAGPGTLIMAAGVQDFNRTEFDRLNEIKGHLEIALLEKHFLREYWWRGGGQRGQSCRSAAGSHRGHGGGCQASGGDRRGPRLPSLNPVCTAAMSLLSKTDTRKE